MAKYASKEPVNGKLAELKAKHFTIEGREARIGRALEILNLPGPSFILDKKTWKWATENAELEDI
jgi:hypothetical protein